MIYGIFIDYYYFRYFAEGLFPQERYLDTSNDGNDPLCSTIFRLEN